MRLPRRREHYRLVETTLGPCGFVWSEQGLSRLQLPEADAVTTERRLRAGTHFAASWAGIAETPVAIARVIADVQRYLTGDNVAFASVALDLSDVGPFHRRVYDAARAIRWGETRSYRELADRAGSPGAARAVGQALSQNPIAIIIPCHRILASDGRLGGFSAHGGIVAKQRLLALEGVRACAPQLPGL
jgi:methylated-DNA-[protein]-cysteine S-methyltransferase